MKSIKNKLTIFLITLMCFVATFCGVFTFTTKPLKNAVAETVVDNGWLKVNYDEEKVGFLLSTDVLDYGSFNFSQIEELKSSLTNVVKDLFYKNIISGSSEVSQGDEVTTFAYDITDLPDDFDWTQYGSLQEVKDYVVNRLSQPEEFKKYVNGEYDIFIDYAIDEYINNYLEEDITEEEIAQEYERIDSALKEVVDEAFVNVVETEKQEAIQEAINQEVDRRVEQVIADAELNGTTFTEEEIEQLKTDTAREVASDNVFMSNTENDVNNSVDSAWSGVLDQAQNKVTERVENVKENDGKAQVSIQDVFAAINTVSIDGKVLFSSNGVSASTLKYIVSLIPLPSELQNYTDTQFGNLVSFNVDISTTYGDISFDCSFGLYGDLSLIRSASSKISQIFDLSIENNNVNLSINAPEVISKVIGKFYESSLFTQEQKQFVFEIFDKKVSEIPDYTIGEFTNFLKDIDFQYWFENLLNADLYNQYFGQYIESVFGRPLTNADIDRLIDKFCSFVAPKAENLSLLTVDEAINWLKDNVPGFSTIADNSKVTTAAQKLINVAKKINWESFNSDYIRDIISRDSFNDRIFNYIDALEDYDHYFEKFMGYAESIINRLPEKLQNLSISSLYNGESFSGSADASLNISSILTRVENALSSRGLTEFAEIIENLSLLIDTQTINLGLSFEAKIPNLYKVSFEVEEDIYSGFVPAGVNGEAVTSLTTITQKNGKNILYWIDSETLNQIESMPARNLVLIPYTEFNAELGEDVSATYSPSAEYTLTVTLDEVLSSPHTFTWYKNGRVISGNTNTLKVKNVDDSGSYYVIVKDTKTGYTATTNTITVEITPKTLDLTGATIDGENVTYNGQDQSGALSLNLTNAYLLTEDEKDIVTANYKFSLVKNEVPVSSLIDAGTYIVSVVNKDSNRNYVFRGISSREFTINKALITAEFTTNYDSPFTYNGSVHTIEINYVVKDQNSNIVPTTVYSANNMGTFSASAQGAYTATVVLSLLNDNYQFTNGSFGDVVVYNLGWEINQATQLYYAEGHVFQTIDGITVTIGNANVPIEYDISVSHAQFDSDVMMKIAKLFPGYDFTVSSSYDIHFEQGGVEKPVFGSFIVNMPIPEEFKDYYNNRLQVVHIFEDDLGELQVEVVSNTSPDFENLKMEFTAEGFSIYAFVGLDGEPFDWFIFLATIFALVLMIFLIVLLIITIKEFKDDGKNGPNDSDDNGNGDKPNDGGNSDGNDAEKIEDSTAVTLDNRAKGNENDLALLQIANEDGSVLIVRSFSARIAQAEDDVKQRYSDLKNYILSYKKARSSLSWNHDAFYSGRKKICKILIKGKTLTAYMAIDPETLAPKYHAKSVKDIAKYVDTPSKIKIKSDRAVKFAKEIIDTIMKGYDVPQGKISMVNYVATNLSDKELLLMGLIKVKKTNKKSPWSK